jgi:hypothetical protein
MGCIYMDLGSTQYPILCRRQCNIGIFKCDEIFEQQKKEIHRVRLGFSQIFLTILSEANVCAYSF